MPNEEISNKKLAELKALCEKAPSDMDIKNAHSIIGEGVEKSIRFDGDVAPGESVYPPGPREPSGYIR